MKQHRRNQKKKKLKKKPLKAKRIAVGGESRCASQAGRRIRRAGQPSKQLRGGTRIWQTRRCGFANDAKGPAGAGKQTFWRLQGKKRKKSDSAKMEERVGDVGYFPHVLPRQRRLIFAGAI